MVSIGTVLVDDQDPLALCPPLLDEIEPSISVPVK